MKSGKCFSSELIRPPTNIIKNVMSMKISFKIVNSMMLNSSIDTPSTVASYNDMGRKKNSL